MSLTLLLSALLQLFSFGSQAPPPDTSGVITGARAKPADASASTGRTEARERAMDTSGVITG